MDRHRPEIGTAPGWREGETKPYPRRYGESMPTVWIMGWIMIWIMIWIMGQPGCQAD